jgi:glycosyltransferase involved in cell wall biosynthesis
LKILFITAWYPIKENPVQGIFVREYAKAVSAVGDEVVILYGQGAKTRIRGLYDYSDSMEDGIRTIRISYFRFPFRPLNYLIYLWSIVRVSKKLIDLGFRAEVIHAQIYSAGVPAVILGRLYGKPVVISEHWSGFLQRKLTWIDKRVAKFAMNNAQWILPVSHSLQKGIEAYGIQGKFNVVPNVVDTTLFHPERNGSKRVQENRILFVGSLSPMKGMPFLLQALAHLQTKRQNWQLDIVGDGSARGEYERMVMKLGLTAKVIFHGLRSKPEVAEFMRKADLLVLPSLVETFGVVAAEALAVGIPVLATRCGGPEEFVTDEVGLLIPPGNTEALLNGLDYMLNHFEKFKSDQISSYAAERFSLQRVGEKLNKIYSECIKKD